MAENFYQLFAQINRIPRPSHHEEKIADFLCDFAVKHNLEYRRDSQNCVVIRKQATTGYENAQPVVILNHMDMVCVAEDGYLRNGHPFDPLNDDIRPYIYTDDKGERWMKAEGTSLGADNGLGLSMALAILADDTLIHPAIEVLTTTNEEDGMSGAEALSRDFIKGRKVINLDSEAYDQITVGAAGACLQVGKWDLTFQSQSEGYQYYRLTIDGGNGGHSGVDINKGRCNCIKSLAEFLYHTYADKDNEMSGIILCSLNGGTANASIASWAEAVLAVSDYDAEKLKVNVEQWKHEVKQTYNTSDSNLSINLSACQSTPSINQGGSIIKCLASLPYGVQEMRKDMDDTVMTSNNIGMIRTTDHELTISCHTRSFDMNEQNKLSDLIKQLMIDYGAREVERLMNTDAWMERPDSPLLALTCRTFKDVLGFEPQKVAMHFVLEAAYYVAKYPGIEIASIGPRIIEPHSTSERVSLDTADKIWLVTIELLRRLAEEKS
ncbi:MAG: beta-Ala-His dipeptidase [Paludibacteraceae bacterium]|nr:beta-Ala-His dipeptidase [Paludibacteraceae bacterium]